MIGKILAGLLIVLVISLFGNYMLLQSNQNLGVQIIELGEKTDELQRQADQFRQEVETLRMQVVDSEYASKGLQASPGSKSITTVAVRPVLVSSGFFQDIRYEGTTMSIKVDVRDGTGLVLVNTAVPTGVDFQTSAKTAVKVAQRHTGIDLAGKDVIFSISSENNEDLQAVDGPSAGMAMAILLVSELQKKEIPDEVLLTGTIREDGSIGPVGGIFEKAKAAAKYGAHTFIVPDGLAVTHVQECEETREGPFLYRSCRLEAKQLSPIMEKEYGMQVVEASDLGDVLAYFG